MFHILWIGIFKHHKKSDLKLENEKSNYKQNKVKNMEIFTSQVTEKVNVLNIQRTDTNK